MASFNDIIVKVGMEIDQFVAGSAKLAKELEAVGAAVDRQVKSFDKLGERAKEIGANLTASITAPIVGIGVVVGKMAEDFELSMRKVTSLLGSDAASSFEPLSAGVLKLSKAMGVDAVGAANALYEAISAGIPKENALEFLEVASKAAIAGVTSTKVAVDGMTNVINAYGLSISEAGKLADAMFQGVNVGKMTFEQLSASIGTAAGTAAVLKVSYQELIAASATITKQGFTAAEAFTMEQAAMKALITPKKQMIELIEKTGYASGVALIQAKGFAGSLQLISEKAGGSIETLAAAYGRVEGLKASLALTGKNAKMAAEDLDAVANKAGAMGKAFEEINKSFSRQMDTFIVRL
jgi:TP901 family phage tail tape measure protein